MESKQMSNANKRTKHMSRSQAFKMTHQANKKQFFCSGKSGFTNKQKSIQNGIMEGNVKGPEVSEDLLNDFNLGL